jgi:hypothetical protein
MNEIKPDSSEWEQHTSRNTQRVGQWTVIWVATCAIAQFGPRFIWDYNTYITILGMLAYLATGVGMILASRRHLNGLDELHQRIFLEASAATLGAGLVCGLGYEMLEDIRLMPFQPEIPHLIILMCITFVTAMMLGHRKYQ